MRYPHARRIMKKVKSMPSSKPKRMLQRMRAMAPMDAAPMTGPMKEKFLPEMKTEPVTPAKRAKVMMPADGMMFGPAKLAAMNSMGNVMMVHARMPSRSPKYWVPMDVADMAILVAMWFVPMNSAKTTKMPMVPRAATVKKSLSEVATFV